MVGRLFKRHMNRLYGISIIILLMTIVMSEHNVNIWDFLFVYATILTLYVLFMGDLTNKDLIEINFVIKHVFVKSNIKTQAYIAGILILASLNWLAFFCLGMLIIFLLIDIIMGDINLDMLPFFVHKASDDIKDKVDSLDNTVYETKDFYIAYINGYVVFILKTQYIALNSISNSVKIKKMKDSSVNLLDRKEVITFTYIANKLNKV